MIYNSLFYIAFYCATVLVTLTTIVFTKLQKRTDRRQNRLFLLMNYILLFNAATCFLSEFVNPRFALLDGEIAIYKFLQFVYFISHPLLAPILLNYVLNVTGFLNERLNLLKILFLIPTAVVEILVLLNPFFHFVYSYGPGMMFQREWAEVIVYVVALVYFIAAFVCLMFSWNTMLRRRRWSLAYFFVVSLTGLLLQLFVINIKSELFAESIALVGLMMAIENEEGRLDSETGFYNRNALKMDVNHLISGNRIFQIVCLKLTNLDSFTRMTGLSNTDEIIQEVAAFLKTLMPRYFMYHTDQSTIVMMLDGYNFPKGEDDALRIAEAVDHRFESEWTIHGVPMKISAVVMVAGVPKKISSLADLFYMIDSPVPKDIEHTLLINDDLKFLIRRAEVEAAITSGLAQGNFEVYYQPTYCTDGVTIHGAEALIRLHDPKLGDLFPDEFIPVAEQTGYIDDIDDFVLNEVCAFLKSGVPTRLGMECINVNLSVLQCMQDNFVRKIREIVDSYGISKSLINFEITESVSATDEKLLSDVITSLKENGFQFSMDDYGTGYSNIHSLFSLDFDIVKIDKSILWDADSSEFGQIILENSVRMIKQMKMKILVEGVEKMQHVEKLKKLGVDYYQGYFFSKPVTQKELVRYCSSK